VQNYHHRPLKKFNLSGVIYDDSVVGRLKSEYVRLLTSEMRLTGYAPRLDIEQDFTVDYNEKKKCFEFELTIYAVHVGKRKSEWIDGIDGQKVIYTPQSKSKEYSPHQA
jgi:hypothetical protein